MPLPLKRSPANSCPFGPCLQVSQQNSFLLIQVLFQLLLLCWISDQSTQLWSHSALAVTELSPPDFQSQPLWVLIFLVQEPRARAAWYGAPQSSMPSACRLQGKGLDPKLHLFYPPQCGLLLMSLAVETCTIMQSPPQSSFKTSPTPQKVPSCQCAANLHSHPH